MPAQEHLLAVISELEAERKKLDTTLEQLRALAGVKASEEPEKVSRAINYNAGPGPETTLAAIRGLAAAVLELLRKTQRPMPQSEIRKTLKAKGRASIDFALHRLLHEGLVKKMPPRPGSIAYTWAVPGFTEPAQDFKASPVAPGSTRHSGVAPVILSILRESTKTMTQQQIRNALTRRGRAMRGASVYLVLNNLMQEGLVKKLRAPNDSRAQYAYCLAEPSKLEPVAKEPEPAREVERPAPAPATGERFFTAKEAGAELGISPWNVYQLSKQGYLRRLPEGKLSYVRFAHSDLKWLAANLGGARAGITPPPYQPPTAIKHLRSRAVVRAERIENGKAKAAAEAAHKRQEEAERNHVQLPPVLVDFDNAEPVLPKPEVWNIHKNISLRQSARIARSLGCEVEVGDHGMRFMPPPGLIGKIKSVSRKQSEKDAGQQLAHWLRRVADYVKNKNAAH